MKIIQYLVTNKNVMINSAYYYYYLCHAKKFYLSVSLGCLVSGLFETKHSYCYYWCLLGLDYSNRDQTLYVTINLINE